MASLYPVSQLSSRLLFVLALAVGTLVTAAPASHAADPPTATVKAPNTLQGTPFVVTFDRPVKGIDATIISVTAPSGAVTGIFICRNDGGTLVNCATGPVSVARLTPQDALVAGEYYTASINTTTQGVVGFDDDLAMAPAETTVRAQTSFGALDDPVTYSWARAKSAKALGGSYFRDATQGSSATVTIKLAAASAPTLVLWGGPSQGIADVSISKRSTEVSSFDVDTYKRRNQQLPTSLGTLARGTYEVKVTVTGAKNANSAGGFVGIDGVVANGTTKAAPKLDVMWPVEDGVRAYNSTKGTSASLTFRGTGINWIAMLWTYNGFARVSIDGVVIEDRDLYGFPLIIIPSTFNYNGLSPDGLHTIVIKCLGIKRTVPLSSGTNINVQGFEVQ